MVQIKKEGVRGSDTRLTVGQLIDQLTQFQAQHGSGQLAVFAAPTGSYYTPYYVSETDTGDDCSDPDDGVRFLS